MTNELRILVVEDEPDGQEVVKGILNHFEIEANAVGTAEEAVQELQTARYSGVVIDLGLPDMDGLELLGVIRQNQATALLPCIAITAFHSSIVKQQALQAGFNAYFTKPLRDVAFIQELNNLLAER